MEYKDVLSLAFQRADELQNYWSFYGTVVLALLGFFASLKADRTLIFGAAFVSAVTFFHLVVDAFTLISVWTLALHLPEAEQGRGK
jgi:hypothetical protein